MLLKKTEGEKGVKEWKLIDTIDVTLENQKNYYKSIINDMELDEIYIHVHIPAWEEEQTNKVIKMAINSSDWYDGQAITQLVGVNSKTESNCWGYVKRILNRWCVSYGSFATGGGLNTIIAGKVANTRPEIIQCVSVSTGSASQLLNIGTVIEVYGR